MNMQSKWLSTAFNLDAGDRLTKVRYRLFCAITALATLTMVACIDSLSGPPVDMTPPTVDYVVARDAYHIDVEFSKDVRRANYSIVETTVSPSSGAQPSAPGDRIIIAAVSYGVSGKTATISTTTAMTGLSLKLTVSSIVGMLGNMQRGPIIKQFTGSSTPDETPPQLTRQWPLPGALRSVGELVLLQFSEAVTPGSFNGGVSWSSEQGPVTFTVDESSEFPESIFLNPSETLAQNSVQTIKLTGIQDYAGNVMPDVEWSFTTEP